MNAKTENILITLKNKIELYKTGTHCIHILLIYYWIFLCFFDPDFRVERFSLVYFMFILPVLLLILFYRRNIFKLARHNLVFLSIILSFILIISVMRHDFMSVLSTFLIVLSIVVITKSDIKVGLTFINLLFLASVIYSLISYHLGIKDYPYFPDLSFKEDLLSGTGWRVSLFRSRPESAMFALFVFASNFFYNTSKSKYLYLFLAFYFVLFSGYRTILFLFVFFISILFLTKVYSFRGRLVYILLSFITIILVFLLILFRSNSVKTVDLSNNRFLTELIFKSKSVYVDTAAFGKSFSRDVLWSHHLSIFSMHPVIGIGAEKLQETFFKTDYSGSTSGSESLFTGWLASYGIISFAFIAYIYLTLKNTIDNGNIFSYFVANLILFSIMFYGSYIVPYNFIFILMFSSTGGLIESKV